MKQLFVTLVFASFIVILMSTKAVAYDVPPLTNFIEGTVPDKSVKSWIRLHIAGGRDHMIPVVWLSAQNFERQYPEVLVSVSPDEYGSFVTFVRSNTCPANKKLYVDRGTLQATEYFQGRSYVRCIMPRLKGCEYLSKIVTLPSIDWTDAKIEPFHQLISELDCTSDKKTEVPMSSKEQSILHVATQYIAAHYPELDSSDTK